MAKAKKRTDEWDSDDWKGKSFRKPEGFGIKPSGPAKRRPSQTGPRHAAVHHEDFIRTIDPVKLMMLPFNAKKDRKIVEFLIGNSEATMKELRDYTEDQPLTPDALRKAIERINEVFQGNQIPLRIDKKREKQGVIRVWLEIII